MGKAHHDRKAMENFLDIIEVIKDPEKYEGAVKELIEKFDKVRDMVELVGPAKEIEKIRSSWGVNAKDLVIGITVQLLPVKRVDNLINTFRDISEQVENVKLVITGIGRELENLKRITKLNKLEDKVVFPGFTINPMLSAAGYDIAVLNSKKEGLPNSIVEYFAVSKAVVSTNVGGVPEIIKDGVNGFLVDINNNKELFRPYKKYNLLQKK